MPILVIQELPRAAAEIAAEISREARGHEDPPEGLILHAVAQTDVGLQVIDIWTSEEDLQRCQQERLGPASGAVFARFLRSPV